MKTTVILFLVMSILTSCNDEGYTPKAFSVKLNQEFAMRFNDQVKLDGEDFSIKFTKVQSDSRCPTGLMCIWEGQFVGEFSCSTCITNPFQLTYRVNRDELAIYKDASFEVVLLEVNPYPEADFQIDLEKYQLILIIKEL